MIEVFWHTLTGFDPALLLAFIGAGLLLNFTPGVDFLLITASAMNGGARIGIAAGLGINIGVICHIVLAAAGVSALLLAYPASYEIIRYAGAAYLLWLAVQAWRDDGHLGEGRPALTMGGAMRRGFLTNILNPKTALFIFAFIPQFTDPAIGPVWLQILILGAIFIFFSLFFILALATAAGQFREVLKPRVRLLNKTVSILFGGLAVRLITD